MNTLDPMTAILPSSMSSSFLDHANTYSTNGSQLVVQSSSSPDSLTGDSVSIVSNMARRAGVNYPAPLSHLHHSNNSTAAAAAAAAALSSSDHFSESSLISTYNRPLSIRTSNLHHQQSHPLSHTTDDLDSDELSQNSRTASAHPHHSHFIYAFQCSLCDTKDDMRS